MAWRRSTLAGHAARPYLRRPAPADPDLGQPVPLRALQQRLERRKRETAHLNGAPLLIATTDGSTPFRVNLHRGDLCHTLLLGPSGNGKTTLLNGMCVGWRRYRRARVCIFTIKGGGEIVTRMLGGVTYDVGAVGPGALGFQPLAHADEPNERIELLDWVLGLLRDQGVVIDTDAREEVTGALDLIAGNPRRAPNPDSSVRVPQHPVAQAGDPALCAGRRHLWPAAG